MNILPKKRWHVRTKENIARVRRDEANAAAELKEVERRARLAEQEARTSLLRTKARARIEREGVEIPQEVQTIDSDKSSEQLRHVNFFEDLESGETTAAANKEHEAEKKREQEEYEKKIGLLTYLGQDSQELTGEKTWWEKLPVDRRKAQLEAESAEEKSSSSKTVFQNEINDPLVTVRKYLGCEGIKRFAEGKTKEKKKKKESKKRKRKYKSSSSDDSHTKKKKKKEIKKDRKKRKRKESSSSSDAVDRETNREEVEREKAEKRAKIEKLRQERLERERIERERTRRLLSGEPLTPTRENSKDAESKSRKYNNQFNPEIARQNKLDAAKKYWLE